MPLSAVISMTVIGVSTALGAFFGNRRRAVALVLMAAVATALGWATRGRDWPYHHEFSTYHRTDALMAQGILARYSFLRGDAKDAERRYREILARPESAFGVGPVEGRVHRARVHNDLGNVLVQRGAIADAAAQFADAVSLQPSFAPAHNNAGAIALLRSDISAARDHLQRALSLMPGSPEAHNNLGLLFARRGKWREAHLQLEEAVRRAPGLEVAGKNLRALGEGRLRGDAPELEALARPMLDDPWIVLRLRRANDDGMTR